ncbi:MAG: hypothetical protein J5873_06495 [Bacteroidales bacterium]|nr:hypothetical protein [Bacteroidales bacterium]
MRPLFPLLFACLLLATPLHAQKRNSDLREQNLQGKVKSVEEWEYGNAEIQEGGRVQVDEETEVLSHHLSLYNRRGNVEEEKSFDSEGKLIGKNKYKYSEVGDLMESSEHNERGKCSGRDVYTYNSYRQFATLTIFRSDGSMQTGTYHYGPDKRLDSIVWNGSTKRKEVFRYDAKKQLIEKQISEKGKLVEKTEYRYDGQGNVVEETHTAADGKRHKTLSAYDSQGRLQSVTQQGKDGLQESKTYWEYDNYGNISVEIWYNEENIQNVRSTCEYTYDAQGNWTRQIWYDDGKVFSVSQRKITYY